MTDIEVKINYFGQVNDRMGEGDIIGDTPPEIQSMIKKSSYVSVVNDFTRIRFTYPKWMIGTAKTNEYKGRVVKAYLVKSRSLDNNSIPQYKLRLVMMTCI